MTEFGTYLADCWVSICGAGGAAIVLRQLPDLTPSPELTRRFRACLWVIIVLMTARVGHWAGWGGLFTMATYAAAPILPLTALLVSEGMMRLHGPKLLKVYCGFGALVFVILAILPTGWMEFTHVLGLLIFQLTALFGVALMVIFRDKTLLSDAENLGLNRMVLSFGLILPFLGTDYLSPVIDGLPVRLGGIAVLGLCLLTININRSSLSQRRIIGSMAALVLAALLLTIVIGTLAALSLPVALQIGAVLLSAVMLMATWQAARALRIEDGYTIMLREIAQSSGTGPDDAVRLIQRGAMVPDALVLRTSDLTDFDTGLLQGLFENKPVRTIVADKSDEQLAWLFSRFEASHAVCITTDPLTLVVFNNPALSASDGDDIGLAALQRIAAQIGGRHPT